MYTKWLAKLEAVSIYYRFSLSKNQIEINCKDWQSFLYIFKMKDRYMAPEVFKRKKYDKKVDVFSFAMILYEVILLFHEKVNATKRLLSFKEEKIWNYVCAGNFFEKGIFLSHIVQMLEGDPPFSQYESYDAAKYMAEGRRPSFRAKGFTTDLKQ